MRICSAISLLIYSIQAAWAFNVSNVVDQNIGFDRDTHVLVAGYSGGMGDLFLKTAVARARRYEQLYPDHQVIVIRNQEASGNDSGWERYMRLHLLERNDLRLSGENLLNYLLQFQTGKIKSLDVYSHSSPLTGMSLQSSLTVERFWSNTPGIELLKDRFASGAYAVIHGCNGGYEQAPMLSSLWSIPVSAALGATDFQQLHNDGRWYFNNVGQFPSEGGWAKENHLSFDKPLAAHQASFRMKPEHTAYIGDWGHLEVGLAFYKFFCNYDGATEDDCSKVMSRALLGYISAKNITLSSSLANYKRVVQDFLCQNNPKVPSYRVRCIQALNRSEFDDEMLFSSLRRGIDANCTMKGCDVKLVCKTNDAGNTRCQAKAQDGGPMPPNKTPKAIIEEYHRYLRGFWLNQLASK